MDAGRSGGLLSLLLLFTRYAALLPPPRSCRTNVHVLAGGRKLAALLLLAICACAAAEEWSWGPDTDEAAPDLTPAARQAPVLKQQEEQQAAAAPQEATKDGEDRQARFLGLGLGKKLCSLGIGDVSIFV